MIGDIDIDNRGIAGGKTTFNAYLNAQPSQLLQPVDAPVREERKRSVDMRAEQGRSPMSTKSWHSRPNDSGVSKPEMLFNRTTLGVDEMGSTFQVFTAVAALDSGFASLGDSYDISKLRDSQSRILSSTPSAPRRS